MLGLWEFFWPPPPWPASISVVIGTGYVSQVAGAGTVGQIAGSGAVAEGNFGIGVIVGNNDGIDV